MSGKSVYVELADNTVIDFDSINRWFIKDAEDGTAQIWVESWSLPRDGGDDPAEAQLKRATYKSHDSAVLALRRWFDAVGAPLVGLKASKGADDE